eukprot:CAMPEP_0183702128 /NCGR_PEP_ID=MMETSP0737-20130205/338_1 /TAXON_ID=385413 /ORGANISM="Thalassiosira miniscula, Strain CCMP1093" /LENGTH=216 /DNA_ID=CAMNT_0025928679 /DNA_START=83 /DNA_END=733 /DNA_ORIENTATION=+
MSFTDTMPRQQNLPYVAAMGFIPVKLTALQHSNKLSRKRLRFQPTVTVRTIDCSMTAEEKSRSYYTAHEMKTFSLEAKAHQKSHSARSNCSVGLEFDLALRGLERHLCPVREQNQMLARKAIIKAQQYLRVSQKKSSEDRLHILARVSFKVSQWSKMIALETARLDSIRASEGNSFVPIPDPVTMAPFPTSIKSKRRRVSYVDNEVSEPSTKRSRC